MFDILSIIFWSLTYIFIIIADFRNRSTKEISIPYLAVIFNFAWEFCAFFFSYGHWGHLAWLSLDILIVYFGICFLGSIRKKVLYVLSLISMCIIFYFIFTLPDGMLLTSFIIDLNMAICYVIWAKKMSPQLKVSIATTKLLGDTSAAIYYSADSVCVAFIAVIVFCCNLYYLCYCFEEKSDTKKIKQKKCRR